MFFISGRLRADLVGLLVLSALALTGLITPREALAGFSSPAVVTIWALFILSSGLTRTGIAHQLGKPLQRLEKGRESVLQAALMLSASLLSALINTTTVAAILLPSTMELARRSGRQPSKLLMPLALGCLLGGPFTSISTAPNILVTDMLRNAGLAPFAIFDFTPITAAIVAGGILFMMAIGRHLLPKGRKPSSGADGNEIIGASYQLDTHISTINIPFGSIFEGRTLAESRIGSALYLTVLALKRKGRLMLAPRPEDILQSGDILIVHGNPTHLERFHASQHLQVEPFDYFKNHLFESLFFAEGIISDDSPLKGLTLDESGLRRKHHVHVTAIYSSSGDEVTDLRGHELSKGDRVFLHGEREALEALLKEGVVASLDIQRGNDLKKTVEKRIELLSVRVPSGSVLAGHDLVESRLGNVFGLTVIGIVRGEDLLCMPSPDEKVQAGDLLILEGSANDLDVLEGLQDLMIEKQSSNMINELESQQIGVTEVLLSPRTQLAGRSLSDLRFRERYGISVLAVWRKGNASRTGLQDMPLQFGDALLVYGQRSSMEILARDPDFLVLDKAAARAPRLEKARTAAAVMLAVIISAMTGIVPIYIAALSGSAIMILVGCLSMEEAYKAIDWKVVFLIACMLPLGAAIENTGIAQMGATALVTAVGGHGPRFIVAALFIVTVLGTQVIPTSALVVLMAPVALNTAASLGISPHLLMMTVAISASSSFASPISHPAHLLVMGPGGYKFMDYVKVGVPVTVISFIVSVALLPILWPPFV